jgi:hypothetical protein
MYSFIHDRNTGGACLVRGDRPFGFVIETSRMLPEGADIDACLRFLCAEMSGEDAPGLEPEALLTTHLRRLCQAACAAEQVKAGGDFLALFGPWISAGQVLALTVGLREIERHHRLVGGDGAAHFACVLDDMGVEGVGPLHYDLDDLERCIDRAVATAPYSTMPRMSSRSESLVISDQDRTRIDALDVWLAARDLRGVSTLIAAIPYACAEDAVLLARYFEQVGGADSPEPFAVAEGTIVQLRRALDLDAGFDAEEVEVDELPPVVRNGARHV